MHLQHESRPARRLAIALEPPGNWARELSLYRRSIFRELGEASALSFPDLAFLTWCLAPGKPLANPRSPGRLRHELDSCWTGVAGPFLAAGLAKRGDLVYLSLEGPLSILATNAAGASARLGLEPDPDPATESGLGFFICRRPDASAPLDPAFPSRFPPLSFLDCSLALVRFEFGDEPLAAASWRTLARSRRRTGP